MSTSRIGNWIVSVKRHSTAISPDRSTVWSFDLEGRPVSWYEGEFTYKRSLASAVHERTRRAGRRARRVLTEEEAGRAFARILEGVARAPRAAMTPDAQARLEAILTWTPERLLAERERYARAYPHPVTILPPDQYLSIVLQATTGCTWNRCTFCSFYQDRPFSVLPEGEFREHVRAVSELLGRGDALRRGIFLADGNALVLKAARLEPVVRVAREAFPGRPLAGFVDLYTGERKPEEEWRALRDLGLTRVAVGIETGHDPLLAWLNKPGSAAEAERFVGTLVRAGLSVAVIFMVGVGGRRFAEGHVRDSVALASRLPLRRGDIVYLSPFVEQAGSAYVERMRAGGVRPLEPAVIDEQRVELDRALRAALPGVTIAPYDLHEFVY